jgi:glycosyltransferase involved in cell wall biosynthesis
LKKFKIAYIIPSLGSTGPVIALRDLIESLAPFVVCDIYFFDSADNPIVFECSTKKISFFDRINEYEYDVIHSHMFRADLYVFINFLFYRGNSRTKFISSCHNELEKDLFFLYGKIISKMTTPLWKYIMNSFDKVVVNSKILAEVNALRKYEVISYIRNRSSKYLIPYTDEREISQFIEGRTVIGYVASLTKRKNHLQIIRFLIKNSNYVAIFLGVGEELSSLQAIIRKNRIENQVLFLGYRQDSRPYYKYFDVYCSPSYSEGFSLSLIDSFSNKVPTVISKLSVWDDLTDKIETVFFQIDDDNSFSEAMKFTEFNRVDLAKNAFNFYIKRFSQDRVSGDYFRLYESTY